MSLIDLSPPVGPETPVWPGDRAFAARDRWSRSSGDTVSVATITTTTHVGAHIDAPAHVHAQGATIDATPLEACIGPCWVVDVADLVRRDRSPHGYAAAALVRARIEECRAVAGAHSSDAGISRLLLRHRAAQTKSAQPRAWDEASPGVDPAFLEWFGAQGGMLLGIDLESFDPLRSDTLPAHTAGFRAGVTLLEGLELSAAPIGPGELFAAPVHWLGVDAAPVRAVLRAPLDPHPLSHSPRSSAR